MRLSNISTPMIRVKTAGREVVVIGNFEGISLRESGKLVGSIAWGKSPWPQQLLNIGRKVKSCINKTPGMNSLGIMEQIIVSPDPKYHAPAAVEGVISESLPSLERNIAEDVQSISAAVQFADGIYVEGEDCPGCGKGKLHGDPGEDLNCSENCGFSVKNKNRGDLGYDLPDDEITSSSTTETDPEARPSRMVRPNVDEDSLHPNHKPIDYGHVNSIFKDKYGDERGDRMYDQMGQGDFPNSIWPAAARIQKEKVRMLRDLGKPISYDQSLDAVKYFPLWKEWVGAGHHRKKKEEKTSAEGGWAKTKEPQVETLPSSTGI